MSLLHVLKVAVGNLVQGYDLVPDKVNVGSSLDTLGERETPSGKQNKRIIKLGFCVKGKSCISLSVPILGIENILCTYSF